MAYLSGLDALGPILKVLGVISLIGIAYFIYSMFKAPVIESKTKIVPEIKLIINDNKVDTLYIYKSN